MYVKNICKKVIRKAFGELKNDDIYRVVKKLQPHPILSFEIHLAEHCNLNCKGCDNFSPIAEPSLIDVDVLEKDLIRLSELCDGTAKRIHLLGGEPLLHPDVIDIMRIVRKYFQNAQIDVYTNGVLLDKQNEEFWETCKNEHINIVVTKYPVKVDYEKSEKKANQYGVGFEYCNGNEEVKKLFRITMDTSGMQDEFDSFVRCHRANACITLKNGKLYTCTTIPNIEHYNKMFNEKLGVTDKDYVDIYSISDFDEMMEKLAKPVPFCRYCAIGADSKLYDWSQSKKEKSEWTL